MGNLLFGIIAAYVHEHKPTLTHTHEHYTCVQTFVPHTLTSTLHTSDCICACTSSLLGFVLFCLVCYNKMPQIRRPISEKFISHSSGGWQF